MNPKDKYRGLTYEELTALPIIRKLLKRKPEAAALVFEGMAKESAVNILLQAKQELADLLAVSHAISEAAGAITKLDQPKEKTDASL